MTYWILLTFVTWIVNVIWIISMANGIKKWWILLPAGILFGHWVGLTANLLF
jgi:hypothetical protein